MIKDKITILSKYVLRYSQILHIKLQAQGEYLVLTILLKKNPSEIYSSYPDSIYLLSTTRIKYKIFNAE